MSNKSLLFYLQNLSSDDIQAAHGVSSNDIFFLMKEKKLTPELEDKLIQELEELYHLKINTAVARTQQKNPKKAKGEKAKKSLSIDKTKKSPSSRKKIDVFSRNEKFDVCNIKLKRNRNFDKIHNIFNFIENISDLLKHAPYEITDYSSAKLFLLTKINDIGAAGLDKDILVSQLNSIIEIWCKSKDIPSRFLFSKNCTIKKDGSAIYIESLGLLSVDNPNMLKFRMEYKWKYYLEKFELIKKGNDFFAEVPFVPKVKNKLQNYEYTPYDGIENFGQGLEMPSVLDKMDAYLSFIEKVNKAYRKPSMDNLNRKHSTWTISGGLPSLGKNR